MTRRGLAEGALIAVGVLLIGVIIERAIYIDRTLAELRLEDAKTRKRIITIEAALRVDSLIDEHVDLMHSEDR